MKSWRVKIRGSHDDFVFDRTFDESQMDSCETAVECALRLLAYDRFRRVRGVLSYWRVRRFDCLSSVVYFFGVLAYGNVSVSFDGEIVQISA